MLNEFMLQYYKCGQTSICGLMLADCLLLANISLSLSQQHGATELGTFGRLRCQRGLLRSEKQTLPRWYPNISVRASVSLWKLRYVNVSLWWLCRATGDFQWPTVRLWAPVRECAGCTCWVGVFSLRAAFLLLKTWERELINWYLHSFPA